MEVEKMPEYKKGDVYVCADPSCTIEVTVTKGCTKEACPVCGPLICCDKPMVKKGSAKTK
jgi:hypothetical protein